MPLANTPGVGPFLLFAKAHALTGTFSEMGCIESGFELIDGHMYYEIRCDGATGEAIYDYTYRGRAPIDLQFVANQTMNDAWEAIYAQWSPDPSEPGMMDGMGVLASSRAFAAYLAPVPGTLWAAHPFPYIVFPQLMWTPDFQIRTKLASKPTSIPVSWRAIRYTRTWSAKSYNTWYHRSATVPT